MRKKKLPQTIEECNAELELTQKKMQQYENRNKMLNRKLSVEKRKERNHRIFLFGGFIESIVPELKTMTEDDGKDFFRLAFERVHRRREYLKNEPRGWKPDNTLGNKGALIHPDGCCALCRGLNLSAQPRRAPSLVACAANRENCIFLRRLALSTLLHPQRERLAAASHSLSSSLNERNGGKPSQSIIAASRSSAGEWQISRCRSRLPKRRKNHERVGRHDP